MKTLALQSESWKQLATLGAAAKPYVEGPAVTLAILLALVTAFALAAMIEAIVFAALTIAIVLSAAAVFFFVAGLGFLIIHPAGDLLLLACLIWLLDLPESSQLAFQETATEIV